MSSIATPHNDLIQECLAFCERAGIKPTTFGQRAVKDRHFIERLQGGGRCWPETDAKVRAYIDDADKAAALLELQRMGQEVDAERGAA